MLKIWSEECKKDTDDNQIYLRLMPSKKDNDIYIDCCKKDGEKIKSSTLLIFDNNIKAIVLMSEVSDKVPLKTDIEGHLLFIKESDYSDIKKKYIDRQMGHFIGLKIKESILNEEDNETKH